MISSKLITCILDKSSVSFDIVREPKKNINYASQCWQRTRYRYRAKGGLITMPQEKHIYNYCG